MARQLVHQRFVHSGPLVLGTAPLKSPTPAEDRDRTVSRRSEPSSRTTLIGEQPNPWDLLQPQDVMKYIIRNTISLSKLQFNVGTSSVISRSKMSHGKN